MARLFFALWPDPQAAAQLARLSAEVALVAEGKPVPAAKIHLTLAFLGEVPDERRAAAVAAASGVRFAPLEVRLDCVGSFRAAQVAWAGSLAPDPALVALQATLARNLAAAGFALEERAFTPHLTLARRTRRRLPRATIPAIAWQADAFALVRSAPGTGEYSNLEVFGPG